MIADWNIEEKFLQSIGQQQQFIVSSYLPILFYIVTATDLSKSTRTSHVNFNVQLGGLKCFLDSYNLK